MGDTRHSVSNISKLKKLGWEPEKGLKEIFDDYINWIKSQGDIGEYFKEADRRMREEGVVRKSVNS